MLLSLCQSKNLQQSQRKKKELKDNKDNNNSNNTTAIFPDLVKCTAPIDRILPSLTFSRGVGHLIRAQNIKTVGDLSALTEHQIEALPIHSPKVATVRSALRSFNNNQMSRETKTPALKSPLVVKGNLNDDSLLGLMIMNYFCVFTAFQMLLCFSRTDTLLFLKYIPNSLALVKFLLIFIPVKKVICFPNQFNIFLF